MMRFLKAHKVTFGFMAVNFAVVFLTYSVFITSNHHSCDTYSALVPGELARVYLGNGRLVQYGLFSMLDAAGLNISNRFAITQMLLTVINAVGTGVLAKRFFDTLGGRTLAQAAIVDFAMLVLVVNPCYLSGWYYWPETCIASCAGMTVLFLALGFWCAPAKRWPAKIACLVFVVLVTCMYQVYLELFLGVAVAYTLLEHGFAATRRCIAELFQIIGICAIGGIASIAAIAAIGALGVEVSRASAAASMGLGERVANVLSFQDDIVLTLYGMLPFGFGLFMWAAPIVGAMVIALRDGKKPKALDVLLVAVCYIGVYAVGFAPNVLASMSWVQPRVVIGVFNVIVLSAILYAYASRGSRTSVGLGAVIAAILLVVMMAKVVDIQANTIRSNAYDDYELSAIAAELRDHEAQTGKDVGRVRYCYDSERVTSYPGVGYVVYDMNDRAMNVSYFFSWALRDALGEPSLAVEPMDEAERARVFGDAEWARFDIGEQVRFDGDTMYVALY